MIFLGEVQFPKFYALRRLPETAVLHSLIDSNPLFASLVLNSYLEHASSPLVKQFQQAIDLPVTSHYVSSGERRKRIYDHNASNNYHNNKPFGAYKIYDDKDT